MFSLRSHQSWTILLAVLLLGTTVGQETSPGDWKDNIAAGQRLWREGRYIEAEAAYLAALNTRPPAMAAWRWH